MLESIYPVENRARALAAGDLPATLSYLDEAAALYRPLNVVTSGVSSTGAPRCSRPASPPMHWPRRRRRYRPSSESAAGAPRRRSCCWPRPTARSPPPGRRSRSTGRRRPTGCPGHSAANCGSRGRRWSWSGRATRPSSPRPRCCARADQVCVRLADAGSDDAAQAHLLAGRVALDLGRRAAADRHLSAAARSLRRGPPLSRVSGWISRALQAQAANDPRALLAACRRGLAVLDEHRFTLGASELRAQATAHGAELALLAQRQAARAGPPRLLLAWSERWRATALAVPAGDPAADTGSPTGWWRCDGDGPLEKARQQGTPQPRSCAREQQRLESLVRACALRTRGRWRRPGASSVGECWRAGAAELIEIVDIDGLLHVLVCAAGTVRQFTAGRTADAARAADLPGSRCAAWPAPGPGTTPAARWLSSWPSPARGLRRRCSARPPAGPERRPRRRSCRRAGSRHPVDADPGAARTGTVGVAPSARAWLQSPSDAAARPTVASSSSAGPGWAAAAPR